MDSCRYDFGKNWYRFIGTVSQSQIENASIQMRRLIGDLGGKTFLDIGSGSGLHSLAALSLGAASVTAIDYDPESVKASSALLGSFAADLPWVVSEGDILNSPINGGQFDVVYSWGVLHHTGDMWKALDSAIKLCSAGGLLVIALYIKTPWCGFWEKEKKFYSRCKMLRPVLDTLFAALVLTRKLLLGRNPFRYVSEYYSSRGMDFLTDIRDWLGGYPYESVTDENIQAFMSSRGLSLVRKFNTLPARGLLGTHCGEWVYKNKE